MSISTSSGGGSREEDRRRKHDGMAHRVSVEDMSQYYSIRTKGRNNS